MAKLRTYRNAGRAHINGSGTFIPTIAIFYALTPKSAQTPIPIEAPISTLGPLGRYTDKNL